MNAVMTVTLENIDRCGRYATSLVEYVINLMAMTYLALRGALLDQSQGLRDDFRVISAQIYFTGWQALPITSLLALGAGGFVILQSSFQLSLMGGKEMIGNMMIAIIVRELAPLLVAMIVIARSGTAVASELGNMRVNKEIQALEVMGINPLSYIVFPRIIGGVISTLCLGFYFNITAIFGGYLTTFLFNNMPFSFYVDSLAQAVTGADVALFFLKNSFSGAAIFIVSSYQGLSVERSPHEVPQVTTKAVLHSLMFVMFFNFTLTALFYLDQLTRLGVL